MDIDVGVGGLARSTFDQVLSSFSATPNRYGGYMFHCVVPLDIWRLEQTCGILLSRSTPSPMNVIRSFVLGINAIMYDLRSETLLDYCSVACVRSRTLPFL